MRRNMLVLIVSLFVGLYSAAPLYAGESDVWLALLGNNPEKAKELFISNRSKGTLQDKLGEYEALFQSEMMLGELPNAYATLKKMVELAEGSSLQGMFLLRLGVISEVSGKVGEFYRFVKRLEGNSNIIDGYTLTVIALIRNKASLRGNDFQGAKEALAKSTRIDKVSRVVGPVYIPQGYGIELGTEIEDDLLIDIAEGYDNVQLDISGKLKLGSVLPSDASPGFAYIYVTLKSEHETRAALDLFSNTITKVWINGLLVSSSSLYADGGVLARNSRSVNLDKGINRILIKAIRNDTLQIGFRNIVDGGRLAGVEVLPYNKEDWVGARLERYSGRVFSKQYLPPFIKLINDQDDVAGALWKNFYYSYTNNYEQGISLHASLLKKYNDSALVQFTAGEFYRGYSNFFESKPRAMMMCEKYIRRAINLRPNYILPTLSLVQILRSSSQDTLALKLVKDVMEKNSEFPWAYRTLAALYRKKGWLALADKAMSEYYKLSSDSAVTVIEYYLEIGEFSKAEGIFDQAVKDNKIPLYVEYNLLMRLNRVEESRGKLIEWSNEFPQDRNTYLSSMVDLAYKDANYKEVETYIKKNIIRNPNNASLMEALGVNYIRMGRMTEGVEALQDAHQLGIKYKPSMQNLPRRVESDTTGEFELINYDIELNSIDLGKITKVDHDRASFANVIRVKVVRIYPDLSTEGYEHHALKIFDQEGVSQLAELSVGAGEILECRTVQPNGDVFIPESSENLTLDKAISMYNANVGSVIEFSKRTASAATHKLEEGFEFSSLNNPVINSKYVLIFPKEMLGQVSMDGGDPEITVDGSDVIFVWDSKDKGGIEPEAHMPRELEEAETVTVTFFSGKYEKPDLISLGYPILTTNEIDNTAREICDGITSTKEKVFAVYKWMAENIQTNQNARSARDTFILKGGTADSKSKLMQVMLGAVNVVSYPLISNIPFSVAGSMLPENRLDSMTEFTMPLILRVENESESQPDIWVGITENMRENRVNDIGTLALGALSLEKSPLGMRLSVVRENELENVSIIEPEISILADGSAVVKGGVEFFGSSAASPRKVFYNSTHASQYVEQIAAQLFPRITQTEFSYPSPDELEEGINNNRESLLLTCKGRVLDYCTKRGNDLYINPLTEGEFVRDLIVKQPRIHPVAISRDLQNTVSKSFTIPEGFVYKNVPSDRVIKSSFGFFILDYTVAGNMLGVSASMLIPAQLIEPEDSMLLNEFLREIKEAVGKGVAIVKLSNMFGEEATDEGVVKPILAGRFDIKILPENIEEIVVEEGAE